MKQYCLSGIGLLSMLAVSAQAQPVIRDFRGVLNASSYATDIARGSWFVVFGTGMGPASLSAYAGALPYPTELSGAKVTFTPLGNGAAIEARLWYTLATQVGALLPSSTPAGDYDVRVIYNNLASAPRRVRVVDRNFGYATTSQTGGGPAQATNANLNGGISLIRFTAGSVNFNGRTWPYRPAYPGESLVLWGTGIGADAKSDLTGETSGDQTEAGSIRVIVGGMEVTPAYAGRSSGAPGLDQINFTLPASVPLGCPVKLVVRVGGRLSNSGSIPIASAGSTACRNSQLSEDQLRILDGGGTVTIGRFSIIKGDTFVSLPGYEFESEGEAVGGDFFKYRADLVGASAEPFRFYTRDLVDTSEPVGNCNVTRQRGVLGEIGPSTSGITQSTTANAGAELLFNGPGVSNRAVPNNSELNLYFLTLFDSGLPPGPPTGSPTLTAGSYTLSGAGGPEMGAFSAQTTFPASFAWTNRAETNVITRNQPLLIQWSGGGREPDAVVSLIAFSRHIVGGTRNDPIYEFGSFVCSAPANAGRFVVPADVTSALVPSTGDITTDDVAILSISADNGPNTGKFTAPILAGGSSPGQLTYSWQITQTVSVR